MVLDIITHAWTLVLFSLVGSAFAFPLVFILSFVYDALTSHFEKTPKILWMFIVTFIGILIAAALVETYLGFTMASLVATASTP